MRRTKGRKWSRIIFIMVAVTFFLLTNGKDVTVAWAKGKPVIEIKAYENLGSGCQSKTVEFLKEMKNKYKGKIALEFIDFSTQKGMDRTRKDGLTCAGILINGEMIFNLDGRLVAFAHPEGYYWTNKDLSEVVKRILNLSTSQKRQQIAENLKTQNESGIVKIKAYYDISLHYLPRTMQILEDIAKKYKGRVAIDIVDFATEKGIKEWQASGLVYSGLIINGKNSFVVKGKEIRFIFPVDYYWTKKDLTAVIESILSKHQGQ